MSYLVLQNPVSFSEEIKKSRFISYLQPVNNLVEAKQFWQQIRAEHPTARHHCWATVAGSPTDSQQYGFSDDGEPAGTAGKPMLNVLIGSGIGGISAVVVRYYGGILLGTGGLVRAYANGVQQALQNAPTILKVERQQYRLVCQYAQWAWLEPLLKSFNVEIVQLQFGVQVDLTLAITIEQVDFLCLELKEHSAGQLKLQRNN